MKKSKNEKSKIYFCNFVFQIHSYNINIMCLIKYNYFYKYYKEYKKS